MKRLLIVLAILAALVAIAAPVPALEPPAFTTVFGETADVARPVDTWKSISKTHGITSADSLRKWNRLPTRRPPFVGELVFLRDPTKYGISWWNFMAGAPARGSVVEQLAVSGVPDSLISLWTVQAETEVPVIITVVSTPDKPLLLDWLTYFDRHKRQNMAKKNVVTKWYDPVSGKPIMQTEAEVWSPVLYQGKLYTLYHFLKCNNVGSAPPETAPAPPVVQVAPPLPPPPPEPVVEIPPPPPTPVVAERTEKKPYGWYTRGVAWTTPVYKALEKSGNQRNVYAGAEMVFRTTRPWLENNIGWALRVWSAVQNDHDFGWGIRTGPRLHLPAILSGTGADFEVGPWYETGQFQYRGYHPLPDGRTAWADSAKFFDDFGGYARLMAYGPQLTFLDFGFRKGRSTEEVTASASIEPGFLYLAGSYGRMTTQDRTRALDHSRRLTFPGSVTRQAEARAGIKLSDEVIPYVIPSRLLEYDLATWYGKHQGPGIGLLLRPGNGWTIDGNAVWSKNQDLDKAPRFPIWAKENELALTVAVVKGWSW